MGNQASAALVAHNAKSEFQSVMSDINKSLGGHAQEGVNNGTNLGPSNHKERKERRKQRDEEYVAKVKARNERKDKISQQWASHRQQNTAVDDNKQAKKGLFSK